MCFVGLCFVMTHVFSQLLYYNMTFWSNSTSPSQWQHSTTRPLVLLVLVRLSWSFRNGVKRPNNRRGATLDPKTHGICGRNGWKKVQVYSGNLPGKHIVCPLCQRKLVAGFRGKVTWKWTATCLSSCQGGYFWLTLQVQQVKELQEGIENLGRKFSPSWKTGERELPWKDGNIWFIMIR